MTRWGAAENVGKSGRSTRLEKNMRPCPVCGKVWTAAAKAVGTGGWRKPLGEPD